MKQKLIAIALTLSACVLTANAATINVARGVGNPGVTVNDSSNTPLSLGGFYMAVGSYQIVPTVIENDPASLIAAVNALTVFGTPGISNSTTLAGILQLSTGITSNGGLTPELWNSKEIFVVVGDKSTKEASSSFAILRTTSPTLFPANVAPVATVTFSVPNGAALNPIQNAGSVSGNVLRLAPIPEPSTALLGALGALGLLRRRRN
jgi:hypothetical protein